MSRTPTAFLPLWTVAVGATAAAFVVHLALRSKTLELGYELGRARQDQSRLREVARVLELEAASYKTPERVDLVARTLLGMQSVPPNRIVCLAVAAGAGDQRSAERSDPTPSDPRSAERSTLAPGARAR